jgi:hypothetical protein
MKFEDLLLRRADLFLSSIVGDGNSRLRALICVGGHWALPRAIMGKHVDEIARMPIERTTAQYCEFVWERYFAYMVRDEGMAAFRKEEEFTGHGVRLFTKSWLLGTIPELSNGLHDHSELRRGPLKHFGIYCLDRIVDVLAYEEPSVKDLGLLPFEDQKPNKAPEPTPGLVTIRAECFSECTKSPTRRQSQRRDLSRRVLPNRNRNEPIQ